MVFNQSRKPFKVLVLRSPARINDRGQLIGHLLDCGALIGLIQASLTRSQARNKEFCFRRSLYRFTYPVFAITGLSPNKVFSALRITPFSPFSASSR